MKRTDTSSVSDLYDLTSKVALVTDATGQLGQTICEALAEQGAHIVVNSRTESDCVKLANEISSEYQKAIGIAGDVTEESEVQDIISRTNDEFGYLDVLVNNAYSGGLAPFEEMSVDQFRTALDGALVSTFLCTRESLSLLREVKG